MIKTLATKLRKCGSYFKITLIAIHAFFRPCFSTCIPLSKQVIHCRCGIKTINF